MIRYMAPSWTNARWYAVGPDDAIACGKIDGALDVGDWSATLMRINWVITPILRVDGRTVPVGTYASMDDALTATWDALAVERNGWAQASR